MNSNNRKTGLSLIEIFITLAIFTILSSLTISKIIDLNKQKKISEVKANLNLIHSLAKSTVSKFESLKFPNLILSNSELRDCFDGIGKNCDCFSGGNCSGTSYPTTLKWNDSAVVSGFDTESNNRLNSDLSLDSKTCSSSACPLTQKTTLEFNCDQKTCYRAIFKIYTSINHDNLSGEEKQLLAAIPNLYSELSSERSDNVDTYRNLSSNCTTAVGYNAQLNKLDCDLDSFNENKLFASNLGLSAQNNSLKISPLTSEEDKEENLEKNDDEINKTDCPSGQVAVLVNNTLQCQTLKLNVCNQVGYEVVEINGEAQCLPQCSSGLVRDSNGSCVPKYLNYSATCGCGFYGSGDPKYLKGQRVSGTSCSTCKQGRPGQPFYFESTTVLSCPIGYVVSTVQNYTLGTGESSYAQVLSSTTAQCVGYSTTEQSRFSWVNTSCQLSCVKQ